MSIQSSKRTPTVYLLSFAMILAPIGNTLISFAGSGLANWYELQVILSFIFTIPLVEYIWLSLLFICGAWLLIRPQKKALYFSLTAILMTLGLAIYRFYSLEVSSIEQDYFKFFSLAAIAGSLVALALISRLIVKTAKQS